MFGGKLTRFDAANVQGMPGVKHVVKVGDSAVAVVTDRWWQAKTALDALPATWDEGPNAKVSSASIAEFIKGGFVLRPSDTRLRDCGPRSSPAHGAVAGKRPSIASGTKLYLYPGIQWSETTAPPSNVMNSRRLTARCLPWFPRKEHLGTADCCIHPPGRNEMIAITPPKFFSKEVAQKQATPFPRQDLLTARNRF